MPFTHIYTIKKSRRIENCRKHTTFRRKTYTSKDEKASFNIQVGNMEVRIPFLKAQPTFGFYTSYKIRGHSPIDTSTNLQ